MEMGKMILWLNYIQKTKFVLVGHLWTSDMISKCGIMSTKFMRPKYLQMQGRCSGETTG